MEKSQSLSVLGGWFAHAPMKAVGANAMDPHYLAYYIEGDALAAKELRLRLYLNGADGRDAAHLAFKRAGDALLARAVQTEEAQIAMALFDGVSPFAHDGNTKVS